MYKINNIFTSKYYHENIIYEKNVSKKYTKLRKERIIIDSKNRNRISIYI